MKINVFVSCFAIFCLAFCIRLSAQSPGYLWAKGSSGTYDDHGTAVSTDKDGNSYVTGYFTSSSITFGATTLTNANTGYADFFIVKYDPLGNIVWAKGASGPGEKKGHSVCTDSSGNVLVAGVFYGPTVTFGSITLTGTSDDAFVVKYSPSGNVIWVKSIEGGSWDIGYSVSVDAYDNVFMAGWFYSPSIVFDGVTYTNNGGYDFFLAKYSPAGNELWIRTTGGNANDVVQSINTDTEGNTLVTGFFFSPTISFGGTTLTNSGPLGTGDIFVVKYNTAGFVVWAKKFGGTYDDFGQDVSMDSYKNVFISGYHYSTSISFGSSTLTNAGVVGSADVFIAKLDSAGNASWAKSFGGTAHDYGKSVVADLYGNVVVSGDFFSSPIAFGSDSLFTSGLSGTSDVFIAQLGPAGNVLWSKKAGGDHNESATGVALDQNQDLFVVGNYISSTISFGPTTLTGYGLDFFIVKLDNTTGVSDHTNWASIENIYPNPFDVSATIEIKGAEKKSYLFFLYDTNGIVVYKTKIENNITEIQKGNLKPGIYFYNLSAAEESHSGKIIIQ